MSRVNWKELRTHLIAWLIFYIVDFGFVLASLKRSLRVSFGPILVLLLSIAHASI